MDKYEFNIKVEQIKKLVGKNDYETAMKIADTIDWRRVRNTNLLSMVAMVYEKNEDYQEAKEILLQAFERAPIGKRLLYKLAELAIKEGNIDEAEAYYKEFGDLASEDPRQQLLRYMILKSKGAPAQQLIHSLESYTSVELDERWLYELAELYSLAGMSDRCVETCDRIMLMFGLGKYVDKAMDLKIQYAPLTNYQMDLVENRDKYEAKLRAVEQEYGTGKRFEEEPEPEEEYYDEEPVSDQVPDIMYQEDVMASGLEATMQEADVQESLAREMSKISYDEPMLQEESKVEHTRVLEDIRRVGRPMTSVKRPRGIFIPENEESIESYSEPVIEEEEPEGPGLEESALDQYSEAESDYNNYENNNEYSDEYGNEYEEEYEDQAHAALQSAVTAEDSEEFPSQADNTYEPYPSDNGFLPEETSDSDDDDRQFIQEDDLEFEDLYDEEEEELEESPVRNHLMIEARTPEKGLLMAVEALKQIHKENGVKNPVAKITGSKLSKRGVLLSADKLAGKDLVIEEAGDLTQESLDELNDLMNHDTSGMIVVLIDNPKQMETLHREHPVLASKFECIGSGEATTDYSAHQAPAYKDQLLREESYDGYGNQESYEQDSYQKEAYPQGDAFQRKAAYDHNPAHSHQSSFEQEDAYNQESSYGQEDAYHQGSSYGQERNYGQEDAYGQGSNYGQEGAYNRERNYAQEDAHNQGSNYNQEDDYDEENSYAQESDFSQIESDDQNNSGKKETVAKRKRFFNPNRKDKKEEPYQQESSYQQENAYTSDNSYIEKRKDRPSLHEESGSASYNEEMDLDEFAQFACRYANEIDCSITGKSMLALYERIEIMEEDGIPLSRANAESLIEEAADRAEKPSIGKRIKSLFSTKYDKDGLLVLKEEHFIY